jgi:hypothetical protein
MLLNSLPVGWLAHRTEIGSSGWRAAAPAVTLRAARIAAMSGQSQPDG